ncbi:MAG: 4'-phosphopantetheinyl transferase superfamily protein [Flavobacteriaceae bacterium]|jgi:phosphopantetheinyl transferase|nr:4'-phosphopantetheinyl transferase superfamily protein [Cryomorphaceae bacterium]MBT4246579.1 4'-phosphopantetheinyl transferase superfamily protein [Flavobacteriaceae bacterium]MBT4613615.1 4'-phosphopantetheinyl transferase superfamily protein [Flavobacteriaceae bacterium]MBT6187743.1 4'-phosphopantetheinyl transferase superfamily protein [Candidatus Neomarinimicrobiota bacterium]
MPFLKEFIINEKTKIKLWKVITGELNPEELNNDDKELLKLKKSNILREQFLATRKVLALENTDYKITYDINGKPSLNTNSNISISHSYEIAAIAISDNSKIGLDIQLNGNKIFNIQHKFLNPSEKLNIGENPSLIILTMIWTSKESIYKAIGLKGTSLSNNIIIDKVVEKDKTGIGYYINGTEKVKFDLKFFYIDEYTICYAYQNPKL